jgi:hypothetical protein
MKTFALRLHLPFNYLPDSPALFPHSISASKDHFWYSYGNNGKRTSQRFNGRDPVDWYDQFEVHIPHGRRVAIGIQKQRDR